MKKLSTILNLELAWKRVKSDLWDDLLPDVLELRDVDYDIEATLANLRTQLEKGYRPADALHIDVPKKAYTLRPGCNLIPEDRIIYQAVADFISSKVKEPPSNACFSHRLNSKSSSRMFKFWRVKWLEMRRKMREAYADSYCCLLKTDIAAYYEQIDHGILIRDMLNGKMEKMEEKEVVSLLRTLLRHWAVSESKHIGIPQGCDASSYLGNLYLKDVDEIMIRMGFKYFRYSDGMFILTKDKHTARKAIQALTHELRKLHLILQELKTDIITEPSKIAEEIGTEDDDKTKTLDYEFERKRRAGKPEETEDEVIKKYNQTTKNNTAKEIDISDFKWCINRLYHLKHDKAVDFILSRLPELPFLADLFSKYLGLFAHREDVQNRIIDFLLSEDNIYEWQEMWLLFTLSKAKRLDDAHLQALRTIVNNKEKYWASRAAAILALGTLGDDTDKRWIRGLYQDENKDYVKRAIAVSVHKLPKSERNSFYSRIENDSYNTARLIKYLKQATIKTI